jgi:L-fucose isomerase-like protein
LEKPSVYLIPIASPLHVERVPGPIIRARSLLEESGIKVFGPRKPIREAGEFPSAKTEEFDAVVIFIASGGTSTLATELMAGKEWTMWSYHENNSLPAALDAREKLMEKQAWKATFVYNNLSAAPREIVSETYASGAAKALRNIKVGFFVEEEELPPYQAVIRYFRDRFQVETVPVSVEVLKATTSKIPAESAEHVLKSKLKNAEVVEPSRKDLEKMAKLYLAMRQVALEEDLKAVTVDCYRFLRHTGMNPCVPLAFLSDEGIPGVCEADFPSLLLMLLLRYVTPEPLWMANAAKLDQINGVVALTHCAAPLKLSEPAGLVRIRNHFESGSGVALDVPMRRGKVTLAHLTLNPPKLVIATGRLTESQLGHWKLCRTQADVKLDCEARDFLENSGNHQVLSYGDHSDFLVKAAKKLGLQAYLLG